VTNRFDLLTPASLRAALGGARPPVLVDVRSPEAFAAGRVPGSINVPVHDLGARRAELPASLAAPLVVIGDQRKRALAAARFLSLIGFGGVSVLEGGIGEWDGEIETGPPRPPAPPGPALRVVPSDGDA